MSPAASGSRPSAVLAQVEADLRALWASPPKPGETPTSRACTMNLVVVAPTPEQAEHWVPIIDDVIQAVPARAIVVGLDPRGPDGLAAETSAVCAPAVGGGPMVCSERVTLRAGGGVCARLSSCVAALCSTDVPTTVVWLGRVEEHDPSFALLASEADRIVLDAGQGSLASLAHVVAWARRRAPRDRPGVGDLAWTRLAPWQEMSARFFDEPRLRPVTASVSRIRVVQASAAGAGLGAEGALVLGWLATRLGWSAEPGGGGLRLVRPDGVPLRAQLSADAGGAASVGAGSLLSIAIEASQGEVSLRGFIARDGIDSDTAAWSLEVTAHGEEKRIEQHVRLRSSDPARLLERTLHRPPHDEALADAASWASAVGRGELACT